MLPVAGRLAQQRRAHARGLLEARSTREQGPTGQPGTQCYPQPVLPRRAVARSRWVIAYEGKCLFEGKANWIDQVALAVSYLPSRTIN